jgi:hypothetical protein
LKPLTIASRSSAVPASFLAELTTSSVEALVSSVEAEISCAEAEDCSATAATSPVAVASCSRRSYVV